MGAACAKEGTWSDIVYDRLQNTDWLLKGNAILKVEKISGSRVKYSTKTFYRRFCYKSRDTNLQRFSNGD